MTNEELHDLLSSVKSLLVYDIRTKEQFESGHIEGSIHNTGIFHRSSFVQDILKQVFIESYNKTYFLCTIKN
ncbi:MAG: rhodanese-like domain-containing protein [Nitrosotalea sp.]